MQENKKEEQKEIVMTDEGVQEFEVFPQNEEHLINEAPEDDAPFDSPEEKE